MDEEAFKKKLNPEQYRVMRQKDTERPFSGKFWDHDEHGVYTCAFCGTALFASLSKCEAENGWPTFTGPINIKDVVLIPDGTTAGKSEVTCKECSGHLGYTIEKIHDDTKEMRYVINSASLNFLKLPEINTDDGDKDAEDEKNTSESQKKELSSKTTSGVLSPSIQNILLLFAALLIGGVAGAGYGSYVCQNGIPSLIEPTATSTTEVTTTTEVTVTTGTPRGMGTVSTVVGTTPVASTSAVVATSSAGSATTTVVTTSSTTTSSTGVPPADATSSTSSTTGTP
ncbi:MAG: peptide-methionine (R)-S-oxide reductase [Candidatus Campbellbacteria bacterium]|nr:peptide-methionine (R)-S-oxide reductase [Candidatus Campbellbacteria bacterium]